MRAHIETTRDGLAVDVMLEAGDGETIAIVGPNGAGKTTVLHALAGMIPHVEGEIGDAGVVFQDLRLFPHMSATDNVAFPLRAAGTKTSEARRIATALLDRVGVSHRSDARPGQLSGGERQRVAMARAIAPRPRLLLLDEPLSSLDASAKPAIRALLRETLAAHDGVAIIVSHDPMDVTALASRVVVMEHGRITQQGTPDEIRRRPSGSYAADLVGLNVFEGTLEGLEPGTARLRTPSGDVVVATREDATGTAIATLRPGDVSIHTTEPHGSPRNVVSGPIEEIAAGEERVRVTIASAPTIVAELTIGSLRALGLKRGMLVHASFKATEVALTRT